MITSSYKLLRSGMRSARLLHQLQLTHRPIVFEEFGDTGSERGFERNFGRLRIGANQVLLSGVEIAFALEHEIGARVGGGGGGYRLRRLQFAGEHPQHWRRPLSAIELRQDRAKRRVAALK